MTKLAVFRITRKRLVTALLVLFLAVEGTSSTIGVTRAAETGSIFACMQVLRDNHVTRPDSAKLLRAALEAVRQVLRNAGVSGSLDDLSATGEDQAKAQFNARLDAAVALAQGKVTAKQLDYASCSVMATSMNDSHTWYTSREKIAEDRALSQKAGIGVRFVSYGGRFYIVEVLANSPAARSGVRAFDRIILIDGQSTEGLSAEDVVRRLRGDQGTTVTIAARRPNQADPLSLSITRAPFAAPLVSYRRLEGSVGYVWLASFVRGTSAPAFRTALRDLIRQGIRALVIDLRENRGGSSRDGTEILSMVLRPGLPVETRIDRAGRKETIVTEGNPLLSPSAPVVVLVNQRSASQSELFSAAIREHQRGLLVGRRTAGALGWNDHFALPGGADMSVTTKYLTTGKGVTVEKVGLGPDIDVDLTLESLDRGVDAQLQRAAQAAAGGTR